VTADQLLAVLLVLVVIVGLAILWRDRP